MTPTSDRSLLRGGDSPNSVLQSWLRELLIHRRISGRGRSSVDIVEHILDVEMWIRGSH
jgi:hypothetical protein